MTGEMEPLIAETMDLAQKIIDKPDVPTDKALGLINKMAAISLRLRFQSSEQKVAGDKDGSVRSLELSRGIDQLISTLKYTIKTHWERGYNDRS